MTSLYDYEFAPFTIDGDRRIVTDDWTTIHAYCSGLKRACQTARIRVPVDVFEPWDGPMVDVVGERIAIYKPNNRGITATGFIYMDNPPANCHWLTMREVRSHLFALIDDFPNVTWMLETEHPENVVKMLPSEDDTGLAEAIWGFKGKLVKTRPNLWFYARVDSQAEADARIPHLLQVPAAVRGLVMTPREGVDLCNVSGWKDKAYWWGRTIMGGDGINHVIIRGGAEPMHPDWVRSIIRQCDAAGVPVWCESPVDGRTWNQLPEESK